MCNQEGRIGEEDTVSPAIISSGFALCIAMFLAASIARIPLKGEDAAPYWVLILLAFGLAWNCVIFVKGIVVAVNE